MISFALAGEDCQSLMETFLGSGTIDTTLDITKADSINFFRAAASKNTPVQFILYGYMTTGPFVCVHDFSEEQMNGVTLLNKIEDIFNSNEHHENHASV